MGAAGQIGVSSRSLARLRPGVRLAYDEIRGRIVLLHPLLLDHGRVYLAFSSHADVTPYHGWVFAYTADTLAACGMLCTSPDAALDALSSQVDTTTRRLM